MKGINLISSSVSQDIGFNLARKFLNSAALVLGIAFLITGGIVFYFFYQSGLDIAKNNLTVSSLEKEILSLNKNESYLITVNDRLNKIQNILKGEKKMSELFADLKYISVPGFTLSSLELSSSAKLIKFNFYCQDSQCLSNFNARVEELVRDKKYAQILLPGLTRDQTGRYNISMEWKE